jgi:hypothetical protein
MVGSDTGVLAPMILPSDVGRVVGGIDAAVMQGVVGDAQCHVRSGTPHSYTTPRVPCQSFMDLAPLAWLALAFYHKAVANRVSIASLECGAQQKDKPQQNEKSRGM